VRLDMWYCGVSRRSVFAGWLSFQQSHHEPSNTICVCLAVRVVLIVLSQSFTACYKRLSISQHKTTWEPHPKSATSWMGHQPQAQGREDRIIRCAALNPDSFSACISHAVGCSFKYSFSSFVLRLPSILLRSGKRPNRFTASWCAATDTRMELISGCCEASSVKSLRHCS